MLTYAASVNIAFCSTQTLWPWPLTFNPNINGFSGLIVEHFYVKFGDRKCISFWYIVWKNRQTDKQPWITRDGRRRAQLIVHQLTSVTRVRRTAGDRRQIYRDELGVATGRRLSPDSGTTTDGVVSVLALPCRPRPQTTKNCRLFDRSRAPSPHSAHVENFRLALGFLRRQDSCSHVQHSWTHACLIQTFLNVAAAFNAKGHKDNGLLFELYRNASVRDETTV